MVAPPYTLAELKLALQDHGFSNMAVARQTELLNDAYLDVCSREYWTFLQKSASVNTVAGTAALTLPTDFSTLQSLTIDGQSQTIVPMREETFRKQYAGLYTNQGVPAFYYFIGGQTAGAPVLNLSPIPDAIYAVTIAYVATPVALVNDGDLPLIPVQHQRTILMGALVNAYQLEDEIQMSQRQEQLYEKRLQQMRDDLLILQIDRPEYVIDMYEDDYFLEA